MKMLFCQTSLCIGSSLLRLFLRLRNLSQNVHRESRFENPRGINVAEGETAESHHFSEGYRVVLETTCSR